MIAPDFQVFGALLTALVVELWRESLKSRNKTKLFVDLYGRIRAKIFLVGNAGGRGVPTIVEPTNKKGSHRRQTSDARTHHIFKQFIRFLRITQMVFSAVVFGNALRMPE
jgi:hypothetical protein